MDKPDGNPFPESLRGFWNRLASWKLRFLEPLSGPEDSAS